MATKYNVNRASRKRRWYVSLEFHIKEQTIPVYVYHTAHCSSQYAAIEDAKINADRLLAQHTVARATARLRNVGSSDLDRWIQLKGVKK